MSRFDDAIAAIDAAHREDPNRTLVGGAERPAELVYAERMTAALDRLYPDASEALRLAARGQHIRRWTVPRAHYPEGRAGYHAWRNDLKARHADWTGEILARCGYGPDMIARVGALVRKEGLKSDPEAQALEDAAAIVFLAHYCEDFSRKHEDEKMLSILRKTWSKMSAHGRAAALALPLASGVRALVDRAVGPSSASPHAGQ